jgi:ferredoxin
MVNQRPGLGATGLQDHTLCAENNRFCIISQDCLILELEKCLCRSLGWRAPYLPAAERAQFLVTMAQLASLPNLQLIRCCSRKAAIVVTSTFGVAEESYELGRVQQLELGTQVVNFWATYHPMYPLSQFGQSVRPTVLNHYKALGTPDYQPCQSEACWTCYSKVDSTPEIRAPPGQSSHVEVDSDFEQIDCEVACDCAPIDCEGAPPLDTNQSQAVVRTFDDRLVRYELFIRNCKQERLLRARLRKGPRIARCYAIGRNLFILSFSSEQGAARALPMLNGNWKIAANWALPYEFRLARAGRLEELQSRLLRSENRVGPRTVNADGHSLLEVALSANQHLVATWLAAWAASLG